MPTRRKQQKNKTINERIQEARLDGFKNGVQVGLKEKARQIREALDITECPHTN